MELADKVLLRDRSKALFFYSKNLYAKKTHELSKIRDMLLKVIMV